MEQNPYEPPKAEIGAGSPSPASGATAGQPLPAELEAKAMELLGRLRSSSAGISFGIAFGISTALLLLVTGLLLALIFGGIIGGAISKLWVKSRTDVFVHRVSEELGIPPGVFRPERYLI